MSKLDAIADAVAKLADGGRRLTERVDAMTKRRADAGDTPANLAVLVQTQKQLDDEYRQAAAEVRQITDKQPKGPMNLTPDEVKKSPEYQVAKKKMDAAFAALRNFNGQHAGTINKYRTLVGNNMIIASGVIVRAPSGRVLFLKRSAEGDAAGQWAFPGGKLEDGEDAAKAAVRETFEETGYRLGSAGTFLMRRVKDGVDFTTFVKDVEDEFVPKLNEEHTAFMWMSPSEAQGPRPTPPALQQPGV